MQIEQKISDMKKENLHNNNITSNAITSCCQGRGANNTIRSDCVKHESSGYFLLGKFNKNKSIVEDPTTKMKGVDKFRFSYDF